jgi:hypothetical protein
MSPLFTFSLFEEFSLLSFDRQCIRQSKNRDANIIKRISYFRRFGILILVFVYSINESLQVTQGTVTSEYGRISNIHNENIYVSSSLSIADCIRQCVEFTGKHLEYLMDDCFAYSYDMKKYTCELIHSTQPLDYTVTYKLNWMAGFKY